MVRQLLLTGQDCLLADCFSQSLVVRAASVEEPMHAATISTTTHPTRLSYILLPPRTESFATTATSRGYKPLLRLKRVIKHCTLNHLFGRWRGRSYHAFDHRDGQIPARLLTCADMSDSNDELTQHKTSDSENGLIQREVSEQATSVDPRSPDHYQTNCTSTTLSGRGCGREVQSHDCSDERQSVTEV